MTRSKLIELTLPFRLQALRVPVKWTSEGDGEATILTPVPVPESDRSVSSYDPWEMLKQFQALSEGDNEALVSFLDQVGYFSRAEPLATELFLNWKPTDPNSDKYESRLEMSYVDSEDGPHAVYRTPPIVASTIWSFRRNVLVRAMRFPKKCALDHWDFELRLTQLGGKPAAVITTTCIKDSLVATVLIDQMRGAKFQKCQRPDCPQTFAVLGKRKRKYHDWDCAHIEAVRAQRAREKKGQK